MVGIGYYTLFSVCCGCPEDEVEDICAELEEQEECINIYRETNKAHRQSKID